MWFMEGWCAKCVHEDNKYGGCNIITKSLIHDVDDKKYPNELLCRFDKDGMEVKCTKFESYKEREMKKIEEWNRFVRG
jgi:hypothetical protein